MIGKTVLYKGRDDSPKFYQKVEFDAKSLGGIELSFWSGKIYGPVPFG